MKETISLKITVADDLQNLMQQQKRELMETKSSQQKELKSAKIELEVERKQMI